MRQISQTITAAAITMIVSVISAGVAAMDVNHVPGLMSWISDHQDTRWSGESELWLDPTGNDADVSTATMRIVAKGIDYTWVREGKEQQGELRWNDGVLRWKDSWHQAEFVVLTPIPGHGSLVAAEYSYPAGSGPDWHWRIKFAERPDGSAVLQMTNIAPWGEEARAVRSVYRLQ